MIKDLAMLHAQIDQCKLCVEAGYEITGPPVYSGTVAAGVMIIGQAPGVTEVENHRPFNYTSGTRLFKWLGEAGWDEAEFRARHYMASVTRCYPGKHPNGRGDRVPTLPEQEFCQRWRTAELDLLPNLKVIIPVGKLAIGLFFPKSAPLKSIIGQVKVVEGRSVVPLPHPSGASTWHMQPDHQALIQQAIDQLRLLREKHGL